jgi:hypothetical protein
MNPPPLCFVGSVSAVAILQFRPPPSTLSILFLSRKHTTYCITARSVVDFVLFPLPASLVHELLGGSPA